MWRLFLSPLERPIFLRGHWNAKVPVEGSELEKQPQCSGKISIESGQLGWLSDPYRWLSDLQLGDEKVTLNHLVDNEL